ncbi:MAG TPA: PLDc N-terminal domain-containing protein [Verrucomicrobiota bacterium]|nr:PLDc N-terminal domain-containing protein [Verrucomicrobiota bacterium]
MFAAMIGGFELLFLLGFLLLIPLGIAMFVFWVWMLVHAAQNKGLDDGERVAWILIIALVHFLGALLYFFIGRPKARRLATV